MARRGDGRQVAHEQDGDDQRDPTPHGGFLLIAPDLIRFILYNVGSHPEVHGGNGLSR
jgi:hypothetical protein